MPWQKKNDFSSVTGFTSTLLLKYSRLTRYELLLCWKIIFKLTLWGQALLPKGWICKNTTYGNVRASLAPSSNVWNFWSFCNCRTNCYQLVLNFIKQFCLKETHFLKIFCFMWRVKQDIFDLFSHAELKVHDLSLL